MPREMIVDYPAENSICKTCGQRVRARDRVYPIGAIRDKLRFGVPPLSDQECLFPFRLATGEEIERQRRCSSCEGAGELVGVPCLQCKGTGYQ